MMIKIFFNYIIIQIDVRIILVHKHFDQGNTLF